MNQNLTMVLLGLLAVFFLVTLVLVLDLRKKWLVLFGKSSRTSDDMLKDLVSRLAKVEARIGDLVPRTEILEKISKISLQKTGFKRYNPFSETGGDQSFTFCLLDRDNNGVVLSSLYSRDGTRVYGKKIENGKSVQALSDEEKEVLEETKIKN